MRRHLVPVAGGGDLQRMVCRQRVGCVRWGLVSLHAGHGTLAAEGDFQVCFLNTFMPVVLPIFVAHM